MTALVDPRPERQGNDAATGVFSPLRPYQLEAARAILESVLHQRGLSFSVEIARQGGKNELSARLELLLLLRNAARPVTAIKAAPTQRPQALISRKRLWSLIQQLRIESLCALDGPNAVRVGKASQVFLSAEPTSNIVGHTAGLLLEVDEAQDVDVDKFDKELRPMAASTGATTVFYGTAWDDASLLERARQAHLEAERADGIRRHFEYGWEYVGACSPAYERYVLQERERLGADHPMFLTQYCLKPIPGQGRLLSAQQLSQLHGSHERLEAGRAGETYVAGLDLAGGAAADGAAWAHDYTVLTIGRVVDGQGPLESSIEVVRHYAWQGAPHDVLHGALVSLLRDTWGIARVAVDATGLGETLAAFLEKQLGGSRVQRWKLGAGSKSALGFDLLTAVNGGRLRLYAGDAPELRQCYRELEACRAAYRANKTLNFYVEERDGHDDYVISLALLAATLETASPRRARGRTHSEERQW
jgi:hypothetical protein